MSTIHRTPPFIRSLKDLHIIESFDPITDKPKYVTFYIVTPDDEVYFGQSFKSRRDLTLADCIPMLKYVDDEEIYPRIPNGITLTVANDLTEPEVWIKRPGLNSYESLKGTDYIPKEVLGETLIMEKISKTPHPNIVKYLGCHVRRGYITALILERLPQTLANSVGTAALKEIDVSKFLESLSSAVKYLHSLGLAHNDINPYNIMIKNRAPVLIDFGSCRPFGERLQSLGTPGWYEEEFNTSEKKHDDYALWKLRQWFDNPC
jgi:serine/threonine protein kinase